MRQGGRDRCRYSCRSQIQWLLMLLAASRFDSNSKAKEKLWQREWRGGEWGVPFALFIFALFRLFFALAV